MNARAEALWTSELTNLMAVMCFTVLGYNWRILIEWNNKSILKLILYWRGVIQELKNEFNLLKAFYSNLQLIN